MAKFHAIYGSGHLTLFEKFIKTAFINPAQPSGYESYTVNSGSSITKTANTLTVKSTSNTGYGTTVMMADPVDVTNASTLVIETVLTNAVNGAWRVGVADSNTNGFSNTADSVTNVQYTNTPKTFTVDVSNLSGNKYIFIWNWATNVPFEGVVTNVTLI